MPIAPQLHVEDPRKTKEGAPNVIFGATEGTNTIQDILGGRQLQMERGMMRWKAESKVVPMSLLTGPDSSENWSCYRSMLSAN
jgi:hypothetical protein